MSPPSVNSSTISHRRTHNLLLASRLLNQRDTPSPFTLVLDSLNQSSKPLVKEYIRRAALARIVTIYVSFSTVKPPMGVTHFLQARHLILPKLNEAITQVLTPTSRTLIVFDTLYPVLSSPTFLASLLSPTTTLLATYHKDIPIKSPDYAPDPLELLKYMCTTLITVYSTKHVIAQKRAMDRSLPPPTFGFHDGIISLGSNSPSTQGIVMELEHRRKSGRGVTEWFHLPSLPENTSSHVRERIQLLEDHPLYRPEERKVEDRMVEDDGVNGLTFSLGLTDKQKTDREGVVLPYFDAQKEGGGMGGRILYVPGREDDWDEEEDEI